MLCAASGSAEMRQNKAASLQCGLQNCKQKCPPRNVTCAALPQHYKVSPGVPGGQFVQSMARALHPAHGTLVVNMHSGPRPSLGDMLRWRLRGEPLLTFDLSSDEGRKLLQVARMYR